MSNESNYEQVSEQVYEALLIELVRYAGRSCATTSDDDEMKTLAAERAAAKLERMGYSIGYRLTERIALNKTWSAVPNQDDAAAVAAQQLEVRNDEHFGNVALHIYIDIYIYI